MTEQEWRTSTDPVAMLGFLPQVWALRAENSFPSAAAARKLRLFACACCRQVWDGVEECPGNRAGPCCQTSLCPVCNGSGRVGGLTDPRSRAAVEVAERFADGLEDDEGLRQADYDADRIRRPDRAGAEVAAYWIAHRDLSGSAMESILAWTGPPAVQAALLRDLFGSPWRPLKAGPWLTRTVQMVASVIYCDRRFEDMPILADALEEAGCTDAAVLAHCRNEDLLRFLARTEQGE